MSEDKNKTEVSTEVQNKISEEIKKEIKADSEQIAEYSDVLREKLSEVNEFLAGVLNRSGIFFKLSYPVEEGSEEIYEGCTASEYKRVVRIRNRNSKYSGLYMRIKYKNKITDENEGYTRSFEAFSRYELVLVLNNIENIFTEYAQLVKKRKKKYADLVAKAIKVAEVISA